MVGLQHTLIAFTADHGVARLPELLRESGLPGGRMTTKELFDPMQQALTERFGAGKWLMATAGSSPYLNYDLIDSLHLDPVEVRRVAAAAALKVPHVARVYTRDQLLRGEVGERPRRQPRAARLQQPALGRPRDHPRAVLDAPGRRDHARHAVQLRCAHPADPDGQPDRARPVPTRQVALNDLAPTLATLINVEIPAGSSGRVLTEALRTTATKR